MVVNNLISRYWLEKILSVELNHHPHIAAHLCNQFNHVLTVLISIPRFKSNNLFQAKPKIKFLLQNLRALGALRPDPNGFRRLEAPPPYPQAQLSHCKFLLLHLASSQN